MKIIVLFLSVILVVNIQGQTVSDIDGNVYSTIEIGSQTWMQENLKVVRYQNGDSILTTNPASVDIGQEIDPKYQWAYDGVDSLVNSYGRLYTWYAATDPRKVCPSGWHVPSDQEWDTLINFLGGINNAGSEFLDGDFSAVYAGRRHIGGSFNVLGAATFWWSSDDFHMDSYWKPALSVNGNEVQAFGNLFLNARSLGFSVRCIQDNSITSIEHIKPDHDYLIIDVVNNKVIIDPANITKPVLYIYNLQGQIVLRKEIDTGYNQFDFNHFIHGIYFAQLVGSNFTVQKKWMKIR